MPKAQPPAPSLPGSVARSSTEGYSALPAQVLLAFRSTGNISTTSCPSAVAAAAGTNACIHADSDASCPSPRCYTPSNGGAAASPQTTSSGAYNPGNEFPTPGAPRRSLTTDIASAAALRKRPMDMEKKRSLPAVPPPDEPGDTGGSVRGASEPLRWLWGRMRPRMDPGMTRSMDSTTAITSSADVSTDDHSPRCELQRRSQAVARPILPQILPRLGRVSKAELHFSDLQRSNTEPPARPGRISDWSLGDHQRRARAEAVYGATDSVSHPDKLPPLGFMQRLVKTLARKARPKGRTTQPKSTAMMERQPTTSVLARYSRGNTVGTTTPTASSSVIALDSQVAPCTLGSTNSSHHDAGVLWGPRHSAARGATLFIKILNNDIEDDGDNNDNYNDDDAEEALQLLRLQRRDSKIVHRARLGLGTQPPNLVMGSVTALKVRLPPCGSEALGPQSSALAGPCAGDNGAAGPYARRCASRKPRTSVSSPALLKRYLNSSPEPPAFPVSASFSPPSSPAAATVAPRTSYPSLALLPTNTPSGLPATTTSVSNLAWGVIGDPTTPLSSQRGLASLGSSGGPILRDHRGGRGGDGFKERPSKDRLHFQIASIANLRALLAPLQRGDGGGAGDAADCRDSAPLALRSALRNEGGGCCMSEPVAVLASTRSRRRLAIAAGSTDG